MTGFHSFSSNHSRHCAMSAAADTSVRLSLIMDTAILAVSILVVNLLAVLAILQ